jgi:hypothetical protein
MSIGYYGGTTHWDGCEQHHFVCALARLSEARAEIKKLEELLKQAEEKLDANNNFDWESRNRPEYI